MISSIPLVKTATKSGKQYNAKSGDRRVLIGSFAAPSRVSWPKSSGPLSLRALQCLPVEFSGIIGRQVQTQAV